MSGSAESDRGEIHEALCKPEAAFGRLTLLSEEHHDSAEETASRHERPRVLNREQRRRAEDPWPELADRVRIEREGPNGRRQLVRGDELHIPGSIEADNGNRIGADVLDERRAQKRQHLLDRRCIRDDACKLHERIEGPTNHVA